MSLKLLLCIALLFSFGINPAELFLQFIFAAFEIIAGISSALQQIRDGLTKAKDIIEGLEGIRVAFDEAKGLQMISDKIDEIAAKVTSMDDNLSKSIQTIEAKVEEMALRSLVDAIHMTLLDRLGDVEAVYARVNSTFRGSGNLVLVGERLIQNVISQTRDGLLSSLNEMRAILDPYSKTFWIDDYASLLGKLFRGKPQVGICRARSVQYTFYTLLGRILGAEVKAFTTLSFCYNLKAAAAKENATDLIIKIKTEMQERMQHYYISFVSSLSELPNLVQSCDIPKPSASRMTSVDVRWKRSDVAQNKVITGIRFAMYQDQLQIVVTEGKLGQYGMIIDRGSDKENFTFAKNFDAVQLSDYTTFNLDDITVPDDYVITGIQLAWSFPDRATFKIVVEGTKFNFTTGNLTSPTNTYMSPTPDGRKIKIPPLPVNPNEPPQNCVDPPMNELVDHYAVYNGHENAVFNEALTQNPIKVPMQMIGLDYKQKKNCRAIFGWRYQPLNFNKYMSQKLVEPALEDNH